MSAALDSFAPSIAHLRTIATPVTDYRVLPFGIEEVDGRLGAGGLRAGALHEATARTGALVDDAATTLFLADIAAREEAIAGGPVLWASCRPDIYAPGLAQAGLTAASVIYAHAPNDATLLAVIEDAVRDGTPSAIVAEASKVSMVATRRLQLVAAEADMPVLLLRRRRNRDQDPFSEPSAAWTRWRIGSAPSARLDVAGGVGRQVRQEPFVMTDDADYAWLKGALPRPGANGSDKDWTVIDLRPLRADPPSDASPAWRNVIRRYDLVVMAPELTPSSLVGSR